MSELSTLARPYAEAVFKQALKNKSTTAWSDRLIFLAAVMQNKAMLAIIVNPKVNRQQLTTLLLAICQPQLSEEGSNLLKLLIQNNRLLLTAQIAKRYESFKAEHEGYVDVVVSSAYALTKAEQVKITTMLEKKLNKKAHITTSIDKTLLGGFLAKAGDKVIDGSIKGQLHQLAKIL